MPNVLYGPSDSAIYHYEERLRTLYPNVKDTSLLPKVFQKSNKVLNVLKVSDDGLLVNFEYPGATTAYDAASIMTDKPIPSECGIYYFEVTIISKGVHGESSGCDFHGTSGTGTYFKDSYLAIHEPRLLNQRLMVTNQSRFSRIFKFAFLFSIRLHRCGTV